MSDATELRRLGMRCVYMLTKLKRLNPESNSDAVEFYRAFKDQGLDAATKMYERIFSDHKKAFPNDDLNAVDRLMRLNDAPRAEDR